MATERNGTIKWVDLQGGDCGVERMELLLLWGAEVGERTEAEWSERMCSVAKP